MPGVSLSLSGFSVWLSSSVFPSLWILFPQRSVFSLWLKEIHAGHPAKHLGPCTILLWPVGLPPSCVVIVGMRGGLPWPCWSYGWSSEAWEVSPAQGWVPHIHVLSIPANYVLTYQGPVGQSSGGERSLPVLLEPPLLMVSLPLKQPFLVYKTQLHPWADGSQRRSLAPKHVLNFQRMGL